MKTYNIKEIFGPTIQGEGSHAGKVVNFLRFAGCNRWTGREEDRHKPQTVCTFCDTDFINGTKMSASDIVGYLHKLNSAAKILVISGGEPTLQLDEELCQHLIKAGYKLHLETNGSKDIESISFYFEHITCSPKQSTEKTKLKECHDLKLLYPFINEEITWNKFKEMKHQTAYLQPMWGTPVENTIEYIYTQKNLHLSVQNHKILEVD